MSTVIELDKRTCKLKKCKRSFSVMASSTQNYCCTVHAEEDGVEFMKDNSGIITGLTEEASAKTWARRKRMDKIKKEQARQKALETKRKQAALKREVNSLPKATYLDKFSLKVDQCIPSKNAVRVPVSAPKTATPTILNGAKKKQKREKRTTKKTALEIQLEEKLAGQRTKNIESNKIKNAPSGLKKIGNEKMSMQEPVIKETEKNDSKLSTKGGDVEIPSTASTKQLVIANMVESPSMNLIDSSSQHLFKLMKGLHKNQPEPETRAFDPERVNSACNCAKQIYSLMRLKLDVMKLAKEIEG